MKRILLAAMALGLAVGGCKKQNNATKTKEGEGAKTRQVHKAPEGATLKLAFVTNNASEFWKIAAAGVHKYEKEANIQVDIKLPPNGTTEEQNRIIEDLVSQGYNGIAVSSIAPNDQIAEINRACKKTNVICHDSDCPKSNRLVYIGTNNFEAGKVLGQQIVQLLPNGGKMAVFVGMLGADNASQRLNGIKEAIKGHNIQIVAEKEDNTDRNKARTNVESVINAYPDVNLLCGLWSYNGPAIAKAIDASGKKGKILAAVFDEEEETLQGIENGVVSCTVVQKPFMFGYLSSKMMHDLAVKGEAALPKDEAVDTGVTVINDKPSAANSKNVKEFRAELEALKK